MRHGVLWDLFNLYIRLNLVYRINSTKTYYLQTIFSDYLRIIILSFECYYQKWIAWRNAYFRVRRLKVLFFCSIFPFRRKLDWVKRADRRSKQSICCQQILSEGNSWTLVWLSIFADLSLLFKKNHLRIYLRVFLKLPHVEMVVCQIKII